jgi:hypothetical protein
MAKLTSKPVPKRATKRAEDYAKKVRVEPPKPSRQDIGLDIAKPRGRRIPGQHDHGPQQEPRNKKYPEGGKTRN